MDTNVIDPTFGTEAFKKTLFEIPHPAEIHASAAPKVRERSLEAEFTGDDADEVFGDLEEIYQRDRVIHPEKSANQSRRRRAKALRGMLPGGFWRAFLLEASFSAEAWTLWVIAVLLAAFFTHLFPNP